MNFFIENTNLATAKTSLVVPVFKDKNLTKTAETLDGISKGYISDLFDKGVLTGDVGHALYLPSLANLENSSVLLVGCGDKDKLTAKQYEKVVKEALNNLNKYRLTTASCFFLELKVKGCDQQTVLRRTVEIVQDSLYSFNQFKTDKTIVLPSLEQFAFNLPDSAMAEKETFELALAQGVAIASGVHACKNVANMPPNICTPLYLAEQAQDLDKEFSAISTTIFDTKQLAELKMNSYLAVAQGSVNPAYMSVINYKNGPADQKPIVLVGKGLTFDSGGISLKPGAGMDEMKYDMGGAASVYGTMKALAELNLPINVVGVLAGAENMPDGNAYRPGDILTTMSGKTVEVLNTDAEGRLVLCDVLTFVERFDPECVIDIATLTGACIVALGHKISALVSPNEALAAKILASAKTAHDKAWELPLDDEYTALLESPFADLANIGGRQAGTITAAAFLSKFTEKYDWAHLDIAGTAWNPAGKDKGATGRPVSLLTQFLIDHCS